MGLKIEHFVKWLERTNARIQENKTYLTDLDQAVGDGDHGINMSRGFDEAVKKIKAADYGTPSDLIKDWAMTLLSKVGGASGPLYGTALLKMSVSVKDKEEVDYDSLSAAVFEGLNGIIQRGKAEENQKTMVDVWGPIASFLKESSSFDVKNFKETAKQAMEKTKDMKAIKGRAAYLGERSIGHLDPGSVSSYFLFSSLAEVIEEEGVVL
ncbi:dihydroxyacetone kinase subunit DhaL [Peribacillus sp. SCS-37]|uniref:dihydroxyacetone kinase subunit DhaL n=1 Tax=Paraperibacillus esterisolvens TaxID=3115296 RepID=UPI0039067824